VLLVAAVLLLLFGCGFHVWVSYLSPSAPATTSMISCVISAWR
jgi:hypothetical protein